MSHRNHFKILAVVLVSIFLILPVLIAGPGKSAKVCDVNSVHDGDTMRLTCSGQKIKVRLYCIDTPELAQRPWGPESREFLRSHVGDTVELLEHGKDRYGRILAEVISEGQNLNLALVESGHAAVYVKYCKLDGYYQAEKKASNELLGIWSSPGLHQMPWAWRKKNR